MNPDTKLTLEQIRAICREQDIPYTSHQRIITGFSHEVHKLNNNLVIKVYDRDYHYNFEIETAMLQAEKSFPKPQFKGAGTIKDADRNYLIMSYVPGKSLGGMWHRATNGQREKLVHDICRSLKAINALSPDIIKTNPSGTWRHFLWDKTNELVDELLEANIINGSTGIRTRNAIARYSAVLTDQKLSVVFWDIHFDNFIVNEDFELQAVIDLESTMLAALDYPLFVLQKMTDLPHKYLREDEEKYADIKDYVNLIDWYKKYYPEMFEFENLDTRVKMYQLYDALHLLKDWSKNKETHDELARLIS